MNGDGTMHACRVTGHERDNVLVTYRDPATGNVIEGARIHMIDIVSDEDTVLHDIP